MRAVNIFDPLKTKVESKKSSLHIIQRIYLGSIARFVFANCYRRKVFLNYTVQSRIYLSPKKRSTWGHGNQKLFNWILKVFRYFNSYRLLPRNLKIACIIDGELPLAISFPFVAITCRIWLWLQTDPIIEKYGRRNFINQS